MNAPDKIYFPEDGLPSYIDWDGSPIRTKQVEDSDLCYIRKDVILEWAKETYLTENASAIRKVCFKQLIEKLMSM